MVYFTRDSVHSSIVKSSVNGGIYVLSTWKRILGVIGGGVWEQERERHTE